MVRDGATVKLIGIFSLQVSDFSCTKRVSTHDSHVRRLCGSSFWRKEKRLLLSPSPLRMKSASTASWLPSGELELFR